MLTANLANVAGTVFPILHRQFCLKDSLEAQNATQQERNLLVSTFVGNVGNSIQTPKK